MKNSLITILILLAAIGVFGQIDTLTPMGSGYMFIAIDKHNFNRINEELYKISKAGGAAHIDFIEISGQFSNFPEGIFEFKNCSSIIINSTLPIKLTTQFNSFPQLSFIRITSKITYIDSALTLPELTEFYACRYKSSVFPKALLQSKKLEKLTIEGGSFKSIPIEIGQLEQLKLLVLASNNIKTIPKELYALSSLEVLNLQDNSLKSISEEICSLFKLRELYLLENPNLRLHVTQIECIKKLPRFENLFIDGQF